MSDNVVFLEFGSFSVYWYGVFIAIDIFLTAVLFSCFRRLQGKSFLSGLSAALPCMPAALIGGRIFYCWFAKASFAGGLPDCLDISGGGYAFYGALAGILAVLTAVSLKNRESLPELLDAAAPAVSFAVAIGRFASYVSGDDIGFELTSGNVSRLPFAIWSEDENTWILWVGFFEGLLALAAFVFTSVVFFLIYRKNHRGIKSGSCALMFMLIYGYSQTLLESMRNDSLFMVTLGFVRISQIISIVMAIAATVILSVSICLKSRLRPVHFAMWLLSAAALGAAIWCEVKMSAAVMAQNYSIMGISLAAMLGMSVWLFFDNASAASSVSANETASDELAESVGYEDRDSEESGNISQKTTPRINRYGNESEAAQTGAVSNSARFHQRSNHGRTAEEFRQHDAENAFVHGDDSDNSTNYRQCFPENSPQDTAPRFQHHQTRIRTESDDTRRQSDSVMPSGAPVPQNHGTDSHRFQKRSGHSGSEINHQNAGQNEGMSGHADGREPARFTSRRSGQPRCSAVPRSAVPRSAVSRSAVPRYTVPEPIMLSEQDVQGSFGAPDINGLGR